MLCFNTMPRQQSNSCSIGTKSSLFYPRASLANQTSLDYLKINQDGFSKIIQTSCCKQWIFCLFVCFLTEEISKMKCVSWSHIDVLTCFSPLSGIDLPAAVLLYRGDGKIKLKLFSWLDLHFCSIYVSDQTYGFFFLTGSENTRQERCRCCCCCC